MLLRPGSRVVADAAVLALLVPAKAAVSDVLGREELETAQQHVVLRDLEFFPHHFDLDQFFVGAKEWPGS